MKQERLNKKVLAYFRHRLKYYKYCSIDFIRSEEKRAASIDNFELAEAIKQALKQIQKDKNQTKPDQK